MFNIEHEYSRIKDTGFPSWNRRYRITGPWKFIISTSVGNCCGFNMMEGVPAAMWNKHGTTNHHAELKKFLQCLKEGFYEGSMVARCPIPELRPPFRMGQLFYTQNSYYDNQMQPEFVKVFDWQGESEPNHRTSMFMYSF